MRAAICIVITLLLAGCASSLPHHFSIFLSNDLSSGSGSRTFTQAYTFDGDGLVSGVRTLNVNSRDNYLSCEDQYNTTSNRWVTTHWESSTNSSPGPCSLEAGTPTRASIEAEINSGTLVPVSNGCDEHTCYRITS